MTPEETKEYRSTIEGQLKDKETDIETTITYVTLGLLGLFLTINEKFIPLANSKFKIILLVSVIGFVLSFVFGLINKFKTTKFDREIIDLIDNSDLTQEENEDKLLKKWQKCDTVLQTNRRSIYFLLVFGLIAQLFYFFLNLNEQKKENDSIKIEITVPKVDTFIQLKNTNIHIFQYKDTTK